jgi:hypothetical protein
MNVNPVSTTLFGSPLLWVVLAGLFVGASLSRATMRTRHKGNPEHARTRKWILVCVWLSIAVVMGLLAVFIPGPSRILDPRLGWAAGGAAVIAFCALRFKKALGIPVVVLLLVVVIVSGLFLQSIHAFTGETEIAEIRVINSGAADMRLELVARGSLPVLLNMKGTYFAPIVKVVIFNDLFVFLGAKTWYRFEGVTSFDRNLRQQDSDFRFPQPLGMSEKVWALFERNETRIPGIKTAQIEMVLKRAEQFGSYRIMVQNDGGVQIVPRSG